MLKIVVFAVIQLNLNVISPCNMPILKSRCRDFDPQNVVKKMPIAPSWPQLVLFNFNIYLILFTVSVFMIAMIDETLCLTT